MLIIVGTLFGVLTECVLAYPPIPLNIIGGMPATEGQFPYAVSIRIYGRIVCGGEIISKWYVLTARSCIMWVGVHDIEIGYGSVFWEKQKVVVADELRFNMDPDKDIALVKLIRPFKFCDKVQPIALPDSATQEGDRLTTMGWGSQNNPEKSYEISSQLTYLSQIQINCTVIPFYVPDYKICCGGRKNRGICFNDEGGPLVKIDSLGKHSLIGMIIAHGVPCASGYPDLFLSVYYFKSWIEQIVQSTSSV